LVLNADQDGRYDPSFVQKLNGDLIYQCGQKIFLNHSELCSATTPCLCNGKLLTCMTAKGVQRLFLTDTAPAADLCFAQEAWQLYSLCKEDFKGYLISAPFPALTLPDAQPCQDLLARIEALTAVTKCQQFKIDTLTRELETLKRQLTMWFPGKKAQRLKSIFLILNIRMRWAVKQELHRSMILTLKTIHGLLHLHPMKNRRLPSSCLFLTGMQGRSLPLRSRR